MNQLNVSTQPSEQEEDERTILDMIRAREKSAHEVLARCEKAFITWPKPVLHMKVKDFNEAGFYI